MSRAKRSRAGVGTGAAEDHGDEITNSLTQMRRCIVVVGYALLVLLIASTLVVFA